MVSSVLHLPSLDSVLCALSSLAQKLQSFIQTQPQFNFFQTTFSKSFFFPKAWRAHKAFILILCFSAQVFGSVLHLQVRTLTMFMVGPLCRTRNHLHCVQVDKIPRCRNDSSGRECSQVGKVGSDPPQNPPGFALGSGHEQPLLIDRSAMTDEVPAPSRFLPIGEK